MNVVWRAPAPRWRRNPPVGFIRPCEPALTDRAPAGPGWLHEVKHDGFRILARKERERDPSFSNESHQPSPADIRDGNHFVGAGQQWKRLPIDSRGSGCRAKN
jgi:hypothetical protein